MESKAPTSYLIAVRIRGSAGEGPDALKTLEYLMLDRRFHARILENNPAITGMLRRVQSLVAWGEVDAGTLEGLLEKRAETREGRGLGEDFVKTHLGIDGLAELAGALFSGKVPLEDLWRAGLKRRFRLHPPRGGFKRSTRRTFSDGGELGYRGGEINSLVRRMT